jgi:multimeric flavodoxin WrbA
MSILLLISEGYMIAYIVLGNTRAVSNTESLAKLFADALVAKGIKVEQVLLRKKTINSCIGCDKCHGVTDSFGCVLKDDMPEIANGILAADLVVLASPIYTWMPTPPMKAVMDRIYAFTKYHKGSDAFNLLKMQHFAMIATSGDDCEKNCDLFDEAMRRMATFAKLPYLGYLAAKDHGDGNMARPEVVNEAKTFAEKCVVALTATQ